MAEIERGITSNLLITTSHNPSHFLRRVCKLLSFSLPASQRINRGSLSLKEIRNYCWNIGIHKLLIVKGSKKNDSVSLSCYDFRRSTQLINIEVTLMDFNFPKKGDKDTRIESKINVIEFPPKLPVSLKEAVLKFINPLNDSTMKKISKSNVLIRINSFSDGKLQGQVINTNLNRKIPLYSFYASQIHEVI